MQCEQDGLPHDLAMVMFRDHPLGIEMYCGCIEHGRFTGPGLVSYRDGFAIAQRKEGSV